MAEMNSAAPGGRHQQGRARSKKLSTRVDLTPMVDLGFLLITFFLLTTTLARPRVMQLTLPYQPDEPTEATAWAEGQTLTLLLGGQHRIYYYRGSLANADKPPLVQVTGFGPGGIRNVVQEQLQYVRRLQEQGVLRPQTLPAFLIKPDVTSTYNDFVEIMDELNIAGVTLKATVDITPADQQLIASIPQKQ